MVRSAFSVFRLTRIAHSTLISLGVAIPIGLRSSDWHTALKYGAPVLFIAMSGYLLNDFHDLEGDRENHPSRPLPRGELTPGAAVVSFFFLLGSALILIEALLPDFVKFLFAVSIIAAMNYNYVVAHIPELKNIYFASASLLPLLVIREALGDAAPPLRLAAPLFLFVTGAEILSDVKDCRGDGLTLANRWGPALASFFGFGLKLVAGCLLVAFAFRGVHLLGAITNVVVEVGLIALWAKGFPRSLLLRAMGLQLILAASLQILWI